METTTGHAASNLVRVDIVMEVAQDLVVAVVVVEKRYFRPILHKTEAENKAFELVPILVSRMHVWHRAVLVLHRAVLQTLILDISTKQDARIESSFVHLAGRCSRRIQAWILQRLWPWICPSFLSLALSFCMSDFGDIKPCKPSQKNVSGRRLPDLFTGSTLHHTSVLYKWTTQPCKKLQN